MSVNTGNQLAGHMERTHLIILVTTGRTEATLASEENKFKFATMRAAIHGTAISRVTTMNHLANIFNNSRTRMELINDMFVVISKNGL